MESRRRCMSASFVAPIVETLWISMKIATWNVNSLNVRMPRVLEFLDLHAPDLLLMQETKVDARQVPRPRVRRGGLPRRPSLRRPLGGRRHRRADGDRAHGGRAPGSTASPTPTRRAGWRPRRERCASSPPTSPTAAPSTRRSTRASCASSTPPPSGSAPSQAASWWSRATSTSARATSTSTTRRRSSARPTSPRPSASASRRCWTPAPSTPSASCTPTSPASRGGTTARAFPQEAGAADRRHPRVPAARGAAAECGIDRNFRKGPKPSDHAPLIAEFQ